MENREDIIKQLFPDGEPLLFKMLIQDAIEFGESKSREQEIKFLNNWLDMYSEGESRMLVSERDIFERVKELKECSLNTRRKSHE